MQDCRCDANCNKYGDCCIDSPYKRSYSSSNVDCVKFKFRPQPIYVIRKCTTFMYSFRKKCQSSNDYDEQTENVRLKIPVIGNDGLVYGNQYCAMCNRMYSYTWLNVSVDCDAYSNVSKVSDFDIQGYIRTKKSSKGFVFNTTTATWTYVDENNKTQNCTLRPSSVSTSFKSSLRRCYLNLVSTCQPSSPLNYKSKCKDYTSVVRVRNNGNTTFYNNEYCALCNNVPTSDISCKRNSTFKPITTTSRSSSRSPYSSTSPSTPSSNKNLADANVTTREFLHIRVKQSCADFLDSISVAKLQVETRTSATVKRTRLRRVVQLSDYSARVCEETDAETEADDSQYERSSVLRFVVNSSVVISLVFASLHLYDFFFTSFLSSLTQKAYASYALAIVIGNVGFFASNLIDNLNLCHMLGAVTYFGFLSSFFWLSALAFDISCKIWSCFQDSNVLGSNLTNSQKFTAYSLFSWLLPPVVTFVMSYIAERNDDFILEGSVYETCWFQTDQTLLLFFVFPLVITTSVNLAFYSFSVYVVYNQRSAVLKLSSKYSIDFKYHTALVVTNNLMWSAALIAMYQESAFCWICFGTLNAFLGVVLYFSSPVKHATATKISAYLDQTFGLNKENAQS